MKYICKTNQETAVAEENKSAVGGREEINETAN